MGQASHIDDCVQGGQMGQAVDIDEWYPASDMG